MEIFSSKIDISLFIFVSVIAFLNLTVAVGIARSVNMINIASSLLLFIFGTIAPLWLLLSTYYVVKDNRLEIMSGPFSWNVSLSAIDNVLEAEQPLCSPTFSRDQLAIFYDSGKVIMVSPQEKQKFLSSIGEEISTDSHSMAIAK